MVYLAKTYRKESFMADKSTIVDALSKEFKLTKASARNIVSQVFVTIEHALKKGEPVTISRFGTFWPRDIKPFTGYNPTKKALTSYKGGKTVRLKPSRVLREHLEAA